MKKILLLLTALFVMGGVEMSAKKLDADLSKLPATSENTTWVWDSEAGSGTFEWTATSYNSTELFGTGDYSAYTTLNLVTEAGTANQYRVIIKYNNGKGQTTIGPVSTGELSVNLSDYATGADLTQIATIRLSGSNGVTGNIKVKEVYLEGPDVNYIEASHVFDRPEGVTGVNGMTTSTGPWSIAYPQTVGNETLFGGNIDGDDKSITITDYDYLYFVVSTASEDAHTGLRTFVWNGSERVCLYPHPVEDCAGVTNWTETTWITSPGVYAVKISDYGLLRGFKALQGWAGNAGTIVVSDVYLSKGLVLPSIKYALVGEVEGSSSLTKALADESAVVFDATGVIGSGIELTPANPNAIFIAKEGTLSNTKNVQIGNTIANLEITDKKPLADLTGVTATAATYTRSMTNKFGTICLPYAVTSTASVKYYTIDNLDGGVLTLKEETVLAAGTPAIVEKVSGESITATGSGALAAAGAPTDNLELIGTFEEKTVLAADYAGKNIYAIKNNQFVQGLNSITVPAFRAYFTADASAEANLRLGFGDEATAIEKLTGKNGVEVEAVYSVSGASQPALQKGINLVKFSDGSVKKVIVK